VNYNADLDRASEVAREAIQATERVLPDTAEIVVRSLWDDTGGHMLSGVLLEGRYRIENVRDRSKIRSEVLKNLTKAMQQADIPLPKHGACRTLLAGCSRHGGIAQWPFHAGDDVQGWP